MVTSLPITRISGLDASFVNIPHYSKIAGIENNVHDIESILDDALLQNESDGSSGISGNHNKVVYGMDMQDASRKMDVFLEAAMAMLDEGEGGECHDDAYCRSCLDRIGHAIETCSERLEEECLVYDKVASSEEERALLLSNVLTSVNNNSDMDDIHGEEEEDAAIHR